MDLSMSLLEQLVEIVGRQPGAAERRRARQHLGDWLACAALGAQTDVGHRLNRFRAAMASGGGCPALGRGRGDEASSLLFNASLGNILEMDDVHRCSILHPGPVVIPAALAIAARRGASGDALLNAIVQGYEAVIRVGQSLGVAHYRYWHTTSTAGAFGAAVAAASLLGLSKEAWVWALGNAGARTGGLWQMRHEPCDSKQLHNGWSSLIGVQAALAAEAGLSGPSRLLEGEQGLLAATAEGGVPAAIRADGDWGVWDCTFKPWAACRHAHPAIDAALRVDCDVENIRAVTVSTYGDAVKFCDRAQPRDELQAKFSIQHAVALALRGTPPGLDDFQPACFEAPALAELRERIAVREDAEFQDVYPQHYGARVAVHLCNGDIREAVVQDTLGDPARPLSEVALADKRETLLARAGYSRVQREAFEGAIIELETRGLEPFLSALVEAPAGEVVQ
jgi:2-methylcitrate dehydratase PrpD